MTDARWSEMTEDAIRFRRDHDYLSGGDMAWRYMQAWRDVNFLLLTAPVEMDPEIAAEITRLVVAQPVHPEPLDVALDIEARTRSVGIDVVRREAGLETVDSNDEPQRTEYTPFANDYGDDE